MIEDKRFDALVERARTHARSIADSLATPEKATIFKCVLDHLIQNERANAFERGISWSPLTATGAQIQAMMAGKKRAASKRKKRTR